MTSLDGDIRLMTIFYNDGDDDGNAGADADDGYYDDDKTENGRYQSHDDLFL